jgi:3-hydroxyisobutyrate dehydrogenase-like beta-hydroxyacid dehydrogenase
VDISLIGYGEVGKILAEDLRAAGHGVAAFDTAGSQAMQAHARQHGVRWAASVAEASQGAGLVISAVTASQAVMVAQAVAAAFHARGHGDAVAPFVLDLNSASPGAKQQAAAAVDAAGGRYVEAAVMTSVPPYRLRVPMLLGGPHAASLVPALQDLGFATKVASDRLGVASATKMCRSIVIKGMEAMLIESFSTARHYGVEDAVIASLQETFPGIDWDKQGAYFFQRVIEHGKRRAEEVREVAVTVHEAGLRPHSASGTAERQAEIAALADAGVFGQRGEAGFSRSADWRTEADRLLKTVGSSPGCSR